MVVAHQPGPLHPCANCFVTSVALPHPPGLSSSSLPLHPPSPPGPVLQSLSLASLDPTLSGSSLFVHILHLSHGFEDLSSNGLAAGPGAWGSLGGIGARALSAHTEPFLRLPMLISSSQHLCWSPFHRQGLRVGESSRLWGSALLHLCCFPGSHLYHPSSHPQAAAESLRGPHTQTCPRDSEGPKAQAPTLAPEQYWATRSWAATSLWARPLPQGR